MQFIVSIVILTSFNLFAKSNWCEFDSVFAEKYIQARNNYKKNIVHKKQYWDSPDQYNYGYDRKKNYSQNWESASLREQIQKQFGTTDLNYVVKDNGKILIYPKNITEAKPVIIFDPSGDYFRVVKTKIKDGNIIDKDNYYDRTGNPLVRPRGLTDDQWKTYYESNTHFNALP